MVVALSLYCVLAVSVRRYARILAALPRRWLRGFVFALGAIHQARLALLPAEDRIPDPEPLGFGNYVSAFLSQWLYLEPSKMRLSCRDETV